MFLMPRFRAADAVQAGAVVEYGQVQVAEGSGNFDHNCMWRGMLDRIIDHSLNNAKQGNFWRPGPNRWPARCPCNQQMRDYRQATVAHTTQQQVFRRLRQNRTVARWSVDRINDQPLPCMLSYSACRWGPDHWLQPGRVTAGGQGAAQAGHVSQGLVVQVHTDALAFVFQLPGEAQHTKAQAFTGPGSALGQWPVAWLAQRRKAYR